MSNQFQSTLTGLGELKIFYEGPMKDQFNEEFPIVRAAEKVKKGWSALQVNRPLRVRRNMSVGSTSDGGTLPASGYQGTLQAVIQAKYNYLVFGVTGPMIKASASDIGSFVRSAAYELEMGYQDLKKDVSRQLSWNGDGSLARVNTTTVASTTLVIKARVDGEGAIENGYIDVGSVLDIISSGTVVASGVQVTAVSGTPTSTTATLTLNAPVTCTANDTLVHSGSYGNDIQGLGYSMDGGTSTIYGVDRSQYQVYQGNYYDLSGVQLSLDKLQQAYNAALKRGNGKIQGTYSDFNSLRMYQKLLTPDKRYVNTMQGDGTFGKKQEFYMEFMGTPWVPDQDCPPTIYFLAPDVLKLYVLAEMEFADETGSMYIAQTSTDAFQVRVRYFANLFNEQPNAVARLVNYLSP